MGNSGAVVIALKARRHPAPAQPAAGPEDGSLDIVPTDALPRDLARQRAHWLSGAAALALHVSALAVLGFGFWAIEPSGGGGQHLEAISVRLVSSQVLEAAEQKSTVSNGGATADVATSEGASTPQQKPSQPPNDKADELPAQTEEASKKDNAPAAERRPPQPTDAAAPAGGATARALTASPQAPSAAGASAGEINRYAMAVRAALARSKPRGMQQKGTVTITFGIDADGEVSFARVSASSGHSVLDEATVAAVHRTSFPRPPAGMNAEQLTYVIPFRFK